MENKSNKQVEKNNKEKRCFKCNQQDHVKAYCKNKPCEKYITYCKEKYGCMICKEKGHFAKGCLNNTEKSDRGYSDSVNNSKRALCSVNLSAVCMKSKEFRNVYGSKIVVQPNI